MKKNITITLVAFLVSMFLLKAQNNSRNNIVEFDNNVISIACYMNESLANVSFELTYSGVSSKYEDSLLIVDYRCIEHTIRLWFSYNDNTEKLIGCRIKYENNKQFESIVKILNEKLYRTYDSKYCWGFYSKKYSYFVLIDIDTKEKEIKFYLQ